jgi:hypothetical protein
MKRMVTIGLVLTALGRVDAAASGQGTPEEARTLAIQAAALLRDYGPDKAFPLFNTGVAPWHDRDLFVTVRDSTGRFVAHGDNIALVGLSVLDLRDIDGKPFTREALAIPDAGWVKYKWRNPVTDSAEPRSSYTVRVGDYIVEAGAYAR